MEGERKGRERGQRRGVAQDAMAGCNAAERGERVADENPQVGREWGEQMSL